MSEEWKRAGKSIYVNPDVLGYVAQSGDGC